MPEKKKLTAVERKKIEEQIASLQEALEAEEVAKTPEEEAAAEEELAEQRRRTAELFDKLDLTEEDYDLLVRSVASGSEEELRRIVREELASAATPEGEPEGSVKKLQKDPKAPAVPGDSPPEEPPASKHWTEKKLFGRGEE